MKNPASSTDPVVAGLRVLATSDLHAHLTGRDFTKSADRPGIGLAALAPVIAQARAEVQNTLLFDNGDLIEGTALGEEAADSSGAHPMIAALNHLGCDAATMGNHDFGFGLPVARAVYGQAAFPVVCANLTDLSGQTLWPGHCLLTRSLVHAQGRAPITIGVFGVLPPQVLQWEHRHLGGKAEVVDCVRAARSVVPQLRAAGADLIFALCHTGIAERWRDGAEDAALQVAQIPGVDLVVAGHKHRLFPGSDHAGSAIDPVAGCLAGVPAVMPGWRGSHLGVIDLSLQLSHEGGWKVLGHTSAVRPAAAKADAAVAAMGATQEAAAMRRLAAPVGQTARALHSYFAHLPDSPALKVAAQAVQAHTQAQAEGGKGAGLPVVAAVAAHKAGGFGGPGNYAYVPAGPVALRHIHDLFPYQNTVAAYVTTGAVLLDWMERSACIFNRILPGSTGTALLLPKVYPGIFHHFEGVEAVVDLSADGLYRPDQIRPIGTSPRVRDVTLLGRPLLPDTPLVLATNDHRLWGGGGVPAAPREAVLFDGPATMRAVIAGHLGTAAPASHQRPSWRFAPLGATVRYATSPDAEHHLADLNGLDLRGAAMGEDGFLWLTIAI